MTIPVPTDLVAQLTRDIEALSDRPPMHGVTRSTEPGHTVFRTYSNGQFKEEGATPASFGDLGEMIATTFTQAKAWADEIPRPRQLVWRQTPLVEMHKTGQGLYCRFAFEPAIDLYATPADFWAFIPIADIAASLTVISEACDAMRARGATWLRMQSEHEGGYIAGWRERPDEEEPFNPPANLKETGIWPTA